MEQINEYLLRILIGNSNKGGKFWSPKQTHCVSSQEGRWVYHDFDVGLTGLFSHTRALMGATDKDYGCY